MIILGDLLSDETGSPEELSDEQLQILFDRLLNRRLYGGMNRTEFERAVFTRPFDDWPLGHLQDHRVSVPACLAMQTLEFDEAALADFLSRFLCASLRPHASEMIAECLGLAPLEDAKSLITFRKISEPIFTGLIQRRLDEVWRLWRQQPRPISLTWATLRPVMRSMLLYYGALDLQLIAAWHRAFAQFYSDLSLSSGDGGPTVGGFFKQLERMIKGFEHAANVAQDKRGRGATPAIFRELVDEGYALLAYFGLSIDDPMLPTMVDFLTKKIESLRQKGATTAVAGWRAAAGSETADPVAGMGSKTKSKKPQPAGSRKSFSTLFNDHTAGQRVAFASLRLEALVARADDLLFKTGAELQHFRSWNEALFRRGVDGPSLLLYFINQAVVVGDYRTCLDNVALREGFSTWCNQDEGGKANTQLKTIRKDQAMYTKGRVPVRDEASPLTGSAAFDIHPEYRLGIMRTSVSGHNCPVSAKRRNGLPEHTQRHGITRMPRRKATP